MPADNRKEPGADERAMEALKQLVEFYTGLRIAYALLPIPFPLLARAADSNFFTTAQVELARATTCTHNTEADPELIKRLRDAALSWITTLPLLASYEYDLADRKWILVRHQLQLVQAALADVRRMVDNSDS